MDPAFCWLCLAGYKQSLLISLVTSGDVVEDWEEADVRVTCTPSHICLLIRALKVS